MRAGGSEGLDLLRDFSGEEERSLRKKKKKKLACLSLSLSLSFSRFSSRANSEKQGHREPRDVLVATPRRAVALGTESPQL